MSARGIPTDTLLRRYGDWAPTCFDVKGAFLNGEEEDYSLWFVGPCLVTRDSAALETANYRALLAALEKVDPERVDHEERRFGHWGPGWYDIVLVRPDTAAAGALEECSRALANYPILDEDLLSELELEERDETWKHRDVVRELEKALRAENPEWPEYAEETALENVDTDALRELVERYADWTHDESGANLRIGRTVERISWGDLKALPGFNPPAE